ncbi:MAG TPA: GNAT family N-acetyltransferase [Chloroflexota bacterium]|nr:GNAT family N-acetyltransferase [Chloroflexota bacterium]
MADLPGPYSPPAGRLILALQAGEAIGCVALRPLDLQTCEMKRLYVRPAFRGHKLGRTLASHVIDEAGTIGYATIRLDTSSSMTEAIALYRSLGFTETAPYNDNPLPGALFFERRLRASG